MQIWEHSLIIRLLHKVNKIVSGVAKQVDFSTVETLMHQALEDQVFPGAVLLIQKGRDPIYHRAFGVTNIHSKGAVTLETVFDLASLTKPLATTLAVLLLVQDDRLDLEQPVSSILGVFKGTMKEQIQIRHLLLHTSGLPAHRPYYKQLLSQPRTARRDKLNELLVAEPLSCAIGEKTVYSDIGFMLLRWIVETASGKRLDRFVEEMIYRPLGVTPLFYIDSSRDCPTWCFAATQWCPWRERFLEGDVSDENAFASGGIEGHAGLFGTAKAVGDILGELLAVYQGLPNSELFRQQWVKRFLDRDGGSTRAFGFDMPTPGASSSGTYFSARTVGHLGYTGTSFWSDLEKGVSVILLTNRVHPSVENDRIRTFRPIVHDAAMTCLADAGY